MQQTLYPVPFQIVENDHGKTASNGTLNVSLFGNGSMFMRRAVKGIRSKPVAEEILPLVNELAGELLATPEMTAEQVQQRLLALAGHANVPPPQRIEWLVTELNGVKVYAANNQVIVTTEDLSP